MAQASFDAYVLPRHIGLYSGVPIDRPALLVQRVCGTGIEAIGQAADAITLKKIDLALCVGAESMSRNPIAAYTHRSGFRLGQVEFKDFLWEALMDTAPGCTMGDTAESVAKKYGITREDVDRFAESSFNRALAAQKSCFLSGEIVAVVSEKFELAGYKTRGHTASQERRAALRAIRTCARRPTKRSRRFVRPSAACRPAGTARRSWMERLRPWLVRARMRNRAAFSRLPRVAAVATVGVPPELMSMGPVPAIRKLLEGCDLNLTRSIALKSTKRLARRCLACAGTPARHE